MRFKLFTVIIKLQIAKFLILLGFALSIADYGIALFDFYTNDEASSIVFEETENSEKKEKESSEKEDSKEKDKISQYADEKSASLADVFDTFYPDFYLKNSSIFLEQKTPPPEIL